MELLVEFKGRALVQAGAQLLTLMVLSSNDPAGGATQQFIWKNSLLSLVDPNVSL